MEAFGDRCCTVVGGKVPPWKQASLRASPRLASPHQVDAAAQLVVMPLGLSPYSNHQDSSTVKE